LGEKSLLNLLSQDTLDRDAITTALKIISEQLAAETEQREMRSITSKLKNRGFKELPQAEQITSLRRVSSRITDNKDE
jgi:Trp operon repressor